MDVRSRFVKIKPQPKKAQASRPFMLFTINWNIFTWRENSVSPEEEKPYTIGDAITQLEEAFPWPEDN